MNKLNIKFYIFVAMVISAVPIFSAVPAGSPYDTQVPEFFLEDRVNDELSMPSFLLCFMKNMAADKVIQATGETTTYLAMVDEEGCDGGAQVSSGPQDTSKAAATAAKGAEAATSYQPVDVTVSQASSTDPMIVKAWLKMEQDGLPVHVYIYGSATKGVSDTLPYGEFSFNYTLILPTLSNAILQKGQMSSSGSSLLWSEIGLHGEGYETIRAKLNYDTSVSGNGVLEYIDDEEDDSVVAGYAYDADNFCRKVLQANGADVTEPEFCFFTDEAKGKKEVFNYGLYDPITGDNFDLSGQIGFGLTYTDGSEVKYGWADNNGVHFGEDGNFFADGKTFTVADGSSSIDGETVSLDIIFGKLERFDNTLISLDSLKGLKANTYLSDRVANTFTGITEGSHVGTWDGAKFVVTAKFDCQNDRCAIYPLATAVNLSVADWIGASGDNDLDQINAWIDGFGEVQISEAAMQAPTSSLVTFTLGSQVNPEDFPATLYCFAECMNSSKVAAGVVAIGDGATPDYGSQYVLGNKWGIPAADLVTYTLNTTTKAYGSGDGDIVVGAVSSGLSDQMSAQGWSQSLSTGPLVTDASALACTEWGPNYDYCYKNIVNGSITTYYRWRTSHRPWDQTKRLLDASNNPVVFAQPLNLYFKAPDDSAAYGEFAGKESRVEFGGGTRLWGIPGRCLNTNTGVFVEECRINGTNDSDGYWPWIDLFKIPKNETTGRLYTGRDQTGSYYLSAPIEGAVLLGLNDAAKGTLTLGVTSDLPTVTILDVSPSGGANFIGPFPTRAAKATIIAGELIGD